MVYYELFRMMPRVFVRTAKRKEKEGDLHIWFLDRACFAMLKVPENPLQGFAVLEFIDYIPPPAYRQRWRMIKKAKSICSLKIAYLGYMYVVEHQEVFDVYSAVLQHIDESGLCTCVRNACVRYVELREAGG